MVEDMMITEEEVKETSSSKEKHAEFTQLNDQQIPSGCAVSTVYGEGVVTGYRSSDSSFIVTLSFGATAYLNRKAILCTVLPVDTFEELEHTIETDEESNILSHSHFNRRLWCNSMGILTGTMPITTKRTKSRTEVISQQVLLLLHLHPLLTSHVLPLERAVRCCQPKPKQRKRKLDKNQNTDPEAQIATECAQSQEHHATQHGAKKITGILG